MLRDELRFGSMEAMKVRIAQDKVDALRVLGDI
jgi:FAD synthase